MTKKQELAIQYIELEKEIELLELNLFKKKKILKSAREEYFLLKSNQEQQKL